ncbi:hypothetical protein GCM10009660_08490 [Catellatospora bangladeshensis]
MTPIRRLDMEHEPSSSGARAVHRSPNNRPRTGPPAATLGEEIATAGARPVPDAWPRDSEMPSAATYDALGRDFSTRQR